MASTRSSLPKTDNSPLKSYLPKRIVVSQLPFFRGYVKLFECIAFFWLFKGQVTSNHGIIRKITVNHHDDAILQKPPSTFCSHPTEKHIDGNLRDFALEKNISSGCPCQPHVRSRRRQVGELTLRIQKWGYSMTDSHGTNGFFFTSMNG